MKITPKYIEWEKGIDYQIGSKFVKDGLYYECIESNGNCIYCDFKNFSCIGARCVADDRQDNKHVSFKKIL